MSAVLNNITVYDSAGIIADVGAVYLGHLYQIANPAEAATAFAIQFIIVKILTPEPQAPSQPQTDSDRRWMHFGNAMRSPLALAVTWGLGFAIKEVLLLAAISNVFLGAAYWMTCEIAAKLPSRS